MVSTQIDPNSKARLYEICRQFDFEDFELTILLILVLIIMHF